MLYEINSLPLCLYVHMSEGLMRSLKYMNNDTGTNDTKLDYFKASFSSSGSL